MLQRAANNAYSWWWASHVRTKQSKWLEQNLQDMEERVNNTIQIIDDDGDTFAQRAEMYYRKRPELLNMVEESYRSYRALAERYDHLSRELQSANRTIAIAFPDRVHEFSMDEDEEPNLSQPSSKETEAVSKPGIPKVPPKIPNFRSTSMVSSRKKQLKRIVSTAKAAFAPRSGLTKSEALERIDRLQKGILVLQTETEFVKNTYDNANEKYWDIQSKITEMQQKVCSLEDEFGIGAVIDDNEARTLMATTALKSCQETLEKLQEQHQQSAEEANTDHGRIKEAHTKVASLRKKFLADQHDANEEQGSTSWDLELNDIDEQEKNELEMFRERIRKELDLFSDAPLTVSKLAEKIDEIVGKVVNLETSVSSQKALVKRLRAETDELMARIRSLEEREAMIENAENMKKRINKLEEEVSRVEGLNNNVRAENKMLKTQLTEASCNIDHFIKKLQKVKLEEEFEDLGSSQQVKDVPDSKSDEAVKELEDKLATRDNSSVLENTRKDEKETKDLLSDSVKADGGNSVEDEENDKTMDRESSIDEEMDDEMGTEDEGEQPDWRKLFLTGLEDREKILLDEYTSVLRNYKEVKLKLGDVEKKNRDGFFELALQIRELKNAVHMRDEEIQLLRQKMSPLPNSTDETFSSREGAPESINLAPSTLNSTLSSPVPFQQPVTSLDGESNHEQIDKSQEIITIEDKIRSDIDELLEENLEFWLRFSSSFHQIKKFQTSVRDLRAELYKLKDKMKQEGSTSNSGKHQTMFSDAKPIYKHLRDIQTELTLWLENNGVLKDEIQGRYSSLCNIQEEISRVSNAGPKAKEELSEYQAAKFQGEITNMKQENTKVAHELQAGLDRVRGLKSEVEKILSVLDEELGISASHAPMRSPSSRPRIPLRSFLFGVKLKRQKPQKQQKPSLFTCMSPALQKQYSDLAAAGRLPE